MGPLEVRARFPGGNEEGWEVRLEHGVDAV